MFRCYHNGTRSAGIRVFVVLADFGRLQIYGARRLVRVMYVCVVRTAGLALVRRAFRVASG